MLSVGKRALKYFSCLLCFSSFPPVERDQKVLRSQFAKKGAFMERFQGGKVDEARALKNFRFLLKVRDLLVVLLRNIIFYFEKIKCMDFS